MPINDLLDRLENAEQSWVGKEFLAPLVPGRAVTVRIAGIICTMRVIQRVPRGFQGLALLVAHSTSSARFLRPAGLAERESYLALFPSVRLILIDRAQASGGPGSRVVEWLGLQANARDARVNLTGPASIFLCEEGLERFETVLTRFDGHLFWYERRDPGRDPTIAAYLRERLANHDGRHLPPEAGTLARAGMTPEERSAYDYLRLQAVNAMRDQTELRLAEALEHGQGRLQSYSERGDMYVVNYVIDGRQYTSTVRRDDLTVAVSGICLSGQDRHFDLASLVGVMREGYSRSGEDD